MGTICFVVLLGALAAKCFQLGFRGVSGDGSAALGGVALLLGLGLGLYCLFGIVSILRFGL